MGAERKRTAELTVVIPAYNEEGCIEEVCRDWLKVMTRFGNSRVIVVDDGSRDSTGSKLDDLVRSEHHLVVLHQSNQGHGNALLTGYEKAIQLGSEWIFHVDSDNQFSPDDFGKLWECRNRSSFILARRKDRQDAPHRIVISRLMRLWLVFVFGCSIKDPNVPFRLMRASFLSKLLRSLPGGVFAPNIFLSILAKKSGQDLCEVPVRHVARQTGKVSIIKWRLIRICFRSLLELIRFRLNLSSSLRQIQEP
jgi:dolichol-phosphate mannosyltransferase